MAAYTSPWPMDYLYTIETDGEKTLFTYYPMTSNPHRWVWKQSVSWQQKDGRWYGYQDSFVTYDEIRSAKDFADAYSGGISGTPMDYRTDCKGWEDALENLAGEETYQALLTTPEKAAEYLLNLADGTGTIKRIEGRTAIVEYQFEFGNPVLITMQQPEGSGIWMPEGWEEKKEEPSAVTGEGRVEEKTFTGIIKELYGSMAIVAIDDGQDISGAQAFIRLNKEQQDMAKVEDRVKVTYDGLIQETDPLQIPNQMKVEFLQNSTENEIECQEESIQDHKAEEYHSLKEFRIYSEEEIFVLRSDAGTNNQGFSAVDREVVVEESYISVKYDCTYQENFFDVWVFTERENYENGMMQKFIQMAEDSQPGILDMGEGKEPVSYGGLGKIYGNIFGYWAVEDQKPVIVHIKEEETPYIELVLSHLIWE